MVEGAGFEPSVALPSLGQMSSCTRLPELSRRIISTFAEFAPEERQTHGQTFS
jgi:hypothetical protein